MLSVLLGVTLCMALAWKIRQFVNAPTDKLLQSVLLCLLCATLSYPFGTAGGARLVDDLTGEGVAKFLQNLWLLFAVYFLKCFFVHAVANRHEGRSRARRGLIPLGAALVVMALAMLTTPGTHRDHTYATADMQTNPVAVFYLTGGLYLTYALSAALRWVVGYARASHRPLAIGLWMMAAALGAMVTAAAIREALTFTRWLGTAIPHPLIASVKLLLDLAIPLFVIGVIYPAAVARWASIRLWWHHRQMYQRLEPLWSALHQAFPEDSLHRAHPGTWLDAMSPKAVHRRYYRRVIECRDGLVRISPYLVRFIADGSQEPVPPEKAAHHLHAALQDYRAQQPAPTQALPIAIPDSGGLEDDVRQLALLADNL